MGEEAADVVQYLAQQTQLLASLHWLSSLQVLASIPLTQTVFVQDVADISGVPYQQLLRLIRTTATAGFLHEPQPGLVEHTTLSAQFVKKPFLSDAVAFLSDTALPAALQMGTATRLRNSLVNPKQSLYHPSNQSNLSLCAKSDRNPKSKRQVAAYHRLRQNTFDGSVTEVLSRLDWINLGDATVVQVGARSITTARALIAQQPSLRFIVQMADKDGPDLAKQLDPQINIHFRARGECQLIETAQVYVLYLPGASLYNSREVVLAEIAAEMRIHFGVLRINPQARLLLVAELLPDPGKTENKIEAAARSHDLFLMQLANGGLLDMAQLQELVWNVGDERGSLSIINQVYSHQGPTVVLQVRIKDI
ncbi:Nn.00g077340.m01.CDS01 [Neocucurbitaria sp. VM-36]